MINTDKRLGVYAQLLLASSNNTHWAFCSHWHVGQAAGGSQQRHGETSHNATTAANHRVCTCYFAYHITRLPLFIKRSFRMNHLVNSKRDRVRRQNIMLLDVRNISDIFLT